MRGTVVRVPSWVDLIEERSGYIARQGACGKERPAFAPRGAHLLGQFCEPNNFE